MKATPCGYLAQLYTLQDHMNLLSRSPLFSSPCLDITPARASVIRTTPSAFDCLVSSGPRDIFIFIEDSEKQNYFKNEQSNVFRWCFSTVRDLVEAGSPVALRTRLGGPVC